MRSGLPYNCSYFAAPGLYVDDGKQGPFLAAFGCPGECAWLTTSGIRRSSLCP